VSNVGWLLKAYRTDSRQDETPESLKSRQLRCRFQSQVHRTKLPICGPLVGVVRFSNSPKGVFIATELNWTQLTQLNSVQPSQSYFWLWRHDLQTESTVVHAVEFSSVELSCVAINTPYSRQHRCVVWGNWPCPAIDWRCTEYFALVTPDVEMSSQYKQQPLYGLLTVTTRLSRHQNSQKHQPKRPSSSSNSSQALIPTVLPSPPSLL